MALPTPPPTPGSKGRDGLAPKVPVVFNPKADIRGGNVVTRLPDPGRLGRAPAGSAPQQPTAANHYMGNKGKSQAAVNKAELGKQIAARITKGK